LIGDTPAVQTPKGFQFTVYSLQFTVYSLQFTVYSLQSIGDIGLKLSLFIKNYKGGRNESFKYGMDTKTM
jgi:hypothetical protein